MILAEKITRLRKKNGWSQEELAQQMNVSRQAVSKWEGAQAVPELEKLLQLSALFGVSTDYLLKDELEQEDCTGAPELSGTRVLTLAEAGAYLNERAQAAVRIAAATLLCIVAVIPLLLLAAEAERPGTRLSEELACALGLVFLFALVAVAVVIFIRCGFRNEPYAFLDKEPFETAYGVTGLVRERQKAFRGQYVRCNTAGVCLCVLSPLGLLLAAFTQDDFLCVAALALTLLLAGAGVFLFITAGVRWASMQRLLREGEFSAEEKQKSRRREAVATAYWLCATAVYLIWSFLTEDWSRSWIVWPVAGVLFAAVMALCGLSGRGGDGE